MNIFKKTKNIKEAAGRLWQEHGKSIKLLLKDNFSSDFLSRFRKGEIIISEELIRHNLIKALDGDDEVNLEHLVCSNSRVSVGLIINRLTTKVHAEIQFHIQRAKITVREQRIIVGVHKIHVKGANFMGKIIMAFVNTIISGIFRKSLFPGELAEIVQYDDRAGKIYIHLSELDMIKEKIKKPVLYTSLSLFEYISIIAIRHSNAGLIVKCKWFDF